jgi:hypothetical protein
MFCFRFETAPVADVLPTEHKQFWQEPCKQISRGCSMVTLQERSFWIKGRILPGGNDTEKCGRVKGK